MSQKDYLVNRIKDVLDGLRIRYIRELKFSKKRKFRFDFAIPDMKIAIECEGGIFMGKYARHTNPMGYARDTTKYNLASLEGWKLLRYTTVTIDNAENEIALALLPKYKNDK